MIITNFEDTSENEIWKPAIKIKIDAGRARKIKWKLFEHHEIIESGDLPETIDYGVYVLKIAKEVWVNPSITLRLRDERIKKILRYRELTYKESFEPILNDLAISEAKAYLNEIFRHDKGNPQITEAKINKSKVFLRIFLQREIEHADSIVRDACLLANESLEKFFKIRGVNEVQILFENKIANFYGKERKESAIRIEVAKEQAEKVTWEHFKFGPDILAIAKEVWISPVIRKSLTDKEIIRILNEKVKFKKP
ncbi:MAG: hypothetical protein QW051_04770 [Candidatus Aenigmatarchaeota archaeon]